MSGPVSADGCAVEVYRRLPAMGEPDLAHLLAGAGARILDLGAGTGRIADPVAALGHAVVAVDDSAEMLAHVRLARAHRSRIEDIHLGERFDLVLLASHLVNTPDDALRAALLAAAARHLADGEQIWTQDCTARRLRRDDAAAALAAAGSRLEPGSPAPGWLVAVPG